MPSAKQFLKEEPEKKSASQFLSDQPEEPQDFSFGEMVSNIPSSALEFGKNVIQPFIHPIDTAKGLYAAGQAAGVTVEPLLKAYSEVLPYSMPAQLMKLGEMIGDTGSPEYEQRRADAQAMADAMGKFYKDRYGGWENIKQTAMKDPVGTLADASALLTMGGSALSQLPGRAGQFGGAMKTAGMASEPINIARNAAKTAIVKSIPKSWPLGMYESSAKFSTTLPKAERQAMARTALKNKIMPTAAGVDKLNSMIDDLGRQIDGLIEEATRSGKTIPKKAIYRYLKDARKKVGGMDIEAQRNLDQVDQVAKKIDLWLKKQGKDTLTPSELQEMKRSVYKQVNYDRMNQTSQFGAEEGRKAIGRGAKESIEGVADVKDLNRQQGELIDLQSPLMRSAGRIENRNIVSIDAPMKIGAGGMAGDVPGAAAGFTAALLDHPKIKAQLAIKLKELQDMGMLGLIDNRMLPTLAHYGLLQAGRLDDFTSETQEEKSASKGQ